MDPDATIELLFDAFHENDRDQAEQCLLDLLNWIKKGGFLPSKFAVYDMTESHID